jgi:hypothetical protein
MASYTTQPFAADAAWYYAGVRGPFVPVTPQQFYPQPPDQTWSAAESTSQANAAAGVAVGPYDGAGTLTSFGPQEGAFVPDSAPMPATVSESSTPGRRSSSGYSLEPRRIRIKRIRTVS